MWIDVPPSKVRNDSEPNKAVSNICINVKIFIFKKLDIFFAVES